MTKRLEPASLSAPSAPGNHAAIPDVSLPSRDLATGGTGDILTGMTAGLLAQHPKKPFEAVIAAVYLHGLAGDVAREDKGEQSLIATDLLDGLPEAFRRTRSAAESATVEIG